MVALFSKVYLKISKIFFKKLEYSFLSESNKRLKMHHFHAKLPYQKSNVKTNRMVSTQWNYPKERSFANTDFIF